MKKLLAATGVILIAYVIYSAAAGGAPNGNHPHDPSDSAAAYTVREENNRVVVYRDDALWMKTDTQVSALPKGDRVRLKNGIIVFSEKELKALIEDICS